MYESLLQSSFFVRLLVSVLPALIVVVPLALASRKKDSVSRDDDNVMTTAMRFVGAAFIFIGSFANVTAWQGASSANSSLKTEIASLSALTETILDYKTNAVLQDAVSKITTYLLKWKMKMFFMLKNAGFSCAFVYQRMCDNLL